MIHLNCCKKWATGWLLSLTALTSCGDSEDAVSSLQEAEVVSALVDNRLPSMTLRGHHATYITEDQLTEIAKHIFAERLRAAGMTVSFFDDEWFSFELRLADLDNCSVYRGHGECYTGPRFTSTLFLKDGDSAFDTVSLQVTFSSLRSVDIRHQLGKAIDQLLTELAQRGSLDRLEKRPETPWYDPQTPWY